MSNFVKNTKIINGKKYKLVDYFDDDAEAGRAIHMLKKTGRSVKVFKRAYGYAVYTKTN